MAGFEMRQLTLKDYGAGALAGVLFAVSPFTPPEALPSVLAGAGLTIAVLVYLALRTRPVTAPAGGPSIDSDSRAPTTPPLAWAALAVTALAALPIVQFMYWHWTTSVWVNAHGLLVPFAMGFLGYRALKDDPEPGPESSPWGFAFLLPGLALIVLDLGVGTRYIGAVGLVLCLPGLSLLFLGTRRSRMLRLPLLLSVFAIPLPVTASTHLFLRDITAWGVDGLLTLFGVTHFREGTALTLRSGMYVVADVCSGFSTLYASFAAAVVLVAWAATPARRVALILAAAPLAIACNIVRVTGLILLSQTLGTNLILDTAFHPASGVAAFCVVLFALSAIAGLREAAPAPA